MHEAISDPGLVPREVGKAVGNVRNNGPALIEGMGGHGELAGAGIHEPGVWRGSSRADILRGMFH